MNWHLKQLTEIATELKTGIAGLQQEAAEELLMSKGKNEIRDTRKKTILKMLLGQLTDFMILFLIAAALISGIIGDLTDAAIILIIVLINAAVGVIQEFRAEKAMDALKKMIASEAAVIRNGNQTIIPVSDLVPGDVIILEAGNIIPADIRFFETNFLQVDESTLTGESLNVEKDTRALPEDDYSLGDRLNMGYKGTLVSAGRAKAYVVATGMNTELGKIAQMIQTEEGVTPLQKRLAAFGRRLSVVILLICTLIFVIGRLRGEDIFTMLLTSISLAVAAIPEALPALVTIALAFGAKRLVKNNALIRKLPAVETLGSVGYICSDKTGTLTLNKMTVVDIFETQETSVQDFLPDKPALLYAMALNNNTIRDKDNSWIGESTELALAQFAIHQNIDRIEVERELPRIAELPFDSSRKCMTTFHPCDDGVLVITKGAIDVLLKKLIPAQQKRLVEFELKVKEMAEKGNRVLGYALKQIPALPEALHADEIELDLILVGIAGLIDPPREEAKQAVIECKQAGIIPVMITGDHQLTAKAIATQLGIVSNEEDLVINGPKLNELSDLQFEDIVEKVKVYARVNPEQKLKIIKALQNKGHFVAMTGDGVNDAPALKNADIGIAMGINGTEVSKEAAHMILLDDNFATMVVAVKHGRRIFDNILKFVKYIMTGNSGEIWAIFLAPFFGLPIPLLAIHILWINLVTDGLPGLALASEPAEKNIMQRPPRNPGENIFAGGMAFHILWVGLLMGIVTIGMQAWSLHLENSHWQTMAFTVLCLSQMGHVMAIRSDYKSIFATGVFANKPMLVALLTTVALQLMIIYTPFFNKIFKTQPLTLTELGITIAVSSIVFWAVEAEKCFKRIKTRKTDSSGKLEN